MDWKTVNWVAVVPQALLGLVFTTIIYRRFFSPIRNIPGPAFASISRFWHIYHIIKGDQNLALIKQHEKHGKQKMTGMMASERNDNTDSKQATLSALRTTK